MSAQQDNERPKSDVVVELITDGVKYQENSEGLDGNLVETTKLDYNEIWWMTKDIPHNAFGRFAFFLERLEGLADMAHHHMTVERAEVFAEQIKKICYPYRCSVDAKMSESMRDPHNARSPLIAMVMKHKIEKQYTLKGVAKNRALAGIFGHNDEEERYD